MADLADKLGEFLEDHPYISMALMVIVSLLAVVVAITVAFGLLGLALGVTIGSGALIFKLILSML